MAPKRQSTLKATKTLTSKRRQQQGKKAIPSDIKPIPDSPKIKSSPKKRIISDFEKESALKELKAFDLVSKYGPCVGISRLDRWKRAEKYGKQPPARIEELLTNVALMEALGTDLTESLWYGEV